MSTSGHLTYGDLLESVAVGLARASAALRDPPPADVAQRAAAALARVRLYRGLEDHIVVLGAVRRAELPPPGAVPPPREWQVTHHSPITNLAVSLRHAGAATIAATWNTEANPPTTGPVAVALRDAYQALQLAGEVLASNTGPVDSAVRPRPSTTEGMALLAGVGRDDNLATLARLAAAAADLDVRLSRWMRPEEASRGLRPLLVAAEEDAWRVRGGSLRTSAVIVAGRGHIERAPVLGMSAAPPTDDPQRWAAITSRRDCVEAVDAARSWLLRHLDELTVGQLATASRAALAITHYVGRVHAQTTPGPANVDDLVAAAAQQWRRVLTNAADLRSPVPPHTDYSTLTVALTGTAQWLREQLRPAGAWLQPGPWTDQPAARAGWRRAASEILARMPDLADLLHDATSRAQARGAILASAGVRQPGIGLVHVPDWRPVSPDERRVGQIRAGLRAAAVAGRELAGALGVDHRPGLTDADAARKRAARRSPAQLAAQWYPDGVGSAPASPPPSTGGHLTRSSRALPRTDGGRSPRRG